MTFDYKDVDRNSAKYLLIVTQYDSSSGRAIEHVIDSSSKMINNYSSMTPTCDLVLNLIYNILFCCHYMSTNDNCIIHCYVMNNLNMAADLTGQTSPDVGLIFDWVTVMYQGNSQWRGTMYTAANHSIQAWYVRNINDDTSFYCEYTTSHIYADFERPQSMYLDGDSLHKYMIVMELDSASLSAHMCDMTSETVDRIQPWTSLEINQSFSLEKGWTMQASNAGLSAHNGGHYHRIILAIQGKNHDEAYLIWYNFEASGESWPNLWQHQCISCGVKSYFFTRHCCFQRLV